MGKYLNVGNSGFASVVKDIYVDKTEMIKFINGTLGTKRKLTCFSRPRRFGKSYAAQMLCAYYDKSCDSHELFEGLAISKDPSFEKHLNKYDVIYLDITEFTSEALIRGGLRNLVIDLENAVIDELCVAYPDAERQINLPNMLYTIAEATGQKFIFIIDEFDAIFREAKEDTALQEAYLGFLRSLFKNSSKTDKMIEAAYITGILPIKPCEIGWQDHPHGGKIRGQGPGKKLQAILQEIYPLGRLQSLPEKHRRKETPIMFFRRNI